MSHDLRYGIKLAVIFGGVWFVDLLDSTLLNVALPEISRYFHIDPTNAEWALIAFLLAMTIGMIVSLSVGSFLGLRRVFLIAQWMYLASSLGCGFALNFPQLVFFRIFQGLGGGLAIPIGMTMELSAMPANKWAKTGSYINLFALIAPALGPILAGYITLYLSWRWLFFIKLPLSLIFVVLTHAWVKKAPRKKEGKFDWLGFYFAAFSFGLFLLVLSEFGKPLFSDTMLIFLLALSLAGFGAFIWQEKRASHPLIPFTLFRYPLFAWGNIVQSAANIIFLGSTFIIALYLQWGLGFSIVKTGWILSAVTVGMMCAMPFTGKFYNHLGPVPFIIPGLLLMSLSMFALIWISSETSPWWIALIIFCEGFGSAALQTTNFVSMFSEIPHKLKGPGSALYSLFKQVSASLGIAFSTMALSITLSAHGLVSLHSKTPPAFFYPTFLLLGSIPLLALFCCFFIDNTRALNKMTSHDHLETEIELGAE